ncbi:1,4-dihydroxy-2-naphthoate octaprenyltransferase [Runella defluvii]|uniref:1,4-dihydroxy-2-naphthoate octaprenyltransferase n=1 Tax=Runella defluvii TaxID=370973 RepID=A0A7W5ZQ80_9BACT|nr:UbiA family prenyltransferase [Runella defluvii]MBB3839689.1 1,4-dihydroxy-2-naphthoate octaprenyltransferase [Runella defluvii]
MTPKAILLHLRLPFSLFLMPVYWFSISQSPHFDVTKACWVFVIWHVLVYPASNAYNSYFDKDEGSIGGLEKPPAVDKELFTVAWAMDILAIVLSYFFVGAVFALAVLVYGLVSKSYSHTSIRLKKYPLLSWFIVGLFQGFFVYLSTQQAVLHPYNSLTNNLLPAILSSMMLWAVYPMTQIYQHEEDAKRGDRTLSLLLGIRGTFFFTASIYSLTALCFWVYLPLQQFLLFIVLTSPTLVFFLNWFRKTWLDASQANFKNTMWLNLLASFGLNALFITLLILQK